jgi:hypothetical protein
MGVNFVLRGTFQFYNYKTRIDRAPPSTSSSSYYSFFRKDLVFIIIRASNTVTTAVLISQHTCTHNMGVCPHHHHQQGKMASIRHGLKRYSSYSKAFVMPFLFTIFLLRPVAAEEEESLSRTSMLSPSNLFYSGCLYKHSLQNATNSTPFSPSYRPRVCNSNDPPEALQQGFCRSPDFESYLEIRIATGNWDSATMLGWLTQIVLSEIAGIPSTIESGMYGSSRDFYDIDGAIDYDTGLGADALVTAADLHDSDCTTVAKLPGEEYTPCAHFFPEFWGEPTPVIKELKVEPSQATGFLGYETWFVTKFTAREYPMFVSYHGLERPENRELLAKMFKRPTTWGQYCAEISVNNCSAPDDVAKRAPETEEERQKMFASADESMHSFSETPHYTGHFRYTEKNNCTLWPSNCTGHIANYPCGWSSSECTCSEFRAVSFRKC